MLYDLTFQLLNPVSAQYPHINIRRFYQVIFFADDLSAVDIFTCLVVRARDRDGNLLPIRAGFKLGFSIGLPAAAFGRLEQAPELITSSDCLPDFREQKEPWRGMWGGPCDTRDVSETDIVGAFRKLIPTVRIARSLGLRSCCTAGDGSQLDDGAGLEPSESPLREFIGTLSSSAIMVLRGERGADTPSKLSFAIAAKPPGPPKLDKEARSLQWQIEPTKDLPSGCDLISWTHFRVPYNRARSIRYPNENGLTLNWAFEKKRDMTEERRTYFTCDNIRVYLIPPPHKHVDEDASKLHRRMDTVEERQSDVEASNVIDDMIRNTKMYFDQWLDKFGIMSRVVYRVRDSEFERPDNDYWRFSLESSIIVPRTFDSKLIGSIFIPIVAAFGIDSLRLSHIEEHAKQYFSGSTGLLGATGVFPYWGIFSAQDAWLLFLMGLTGQVLLDLSFRNKREIQPLLFTLMSLSTYFVCGVWFALTFVLRMNLLHGFVLQLAWGLSVALPTFAAIIAFIILPKSYHFLGVGMPFRMAIRSWTESAWSLIQRTLSRRKP